MNSLEGSINLVSNTRNYNLMFFPFFLAGVCLAEVRCHLPGFVKAVIGHWMVVDISILAFFLYSLMVGPCHMFPKNLAFFGIGNGHVGNWGIANFGTGMFYALQPVLYCTML